VATINVAAENTNRRMLMLLRNCQTIEFSSRLSLAGLPAAIFAGPGGNGRAGCGVLQPSCGEAV
jgi:hypothetical protein